LGAAFRLTLDSFLGRSNFEKVIFPSVTVCSKNLARRSFLDAFDPPIFNKTHGPVSSNPFLSAMEQYFYTGGAINESDFYVHSLLAGLDHPERFRSSALAQEYNMTQFKAGYQDRSVRANFTAETFRRAAVEEMGNHSRCS
jgi:hypothetical protein